MNALWADIGKQATEEVKEMLLQPATQATVATSTVVAGVGAIIGIINGIVGLLAVIIGMCLTSFLIFVTWERRKLDRENKLLERKNLQKENDILTLRHTNLANAQYRKERGLKTRRETDKC